MNYLTISGAIISVAAFAISVLAYLQSRKLPNENKIFEEKIRVYHDLIKIMNEAINEIFGCINEYIDDGKTNRLADELHDAIDDAIYSVEDAITNNSLVLPEEVLEKLNAFLELLDKPEYLEKYSTPKKFKQLDNEVERYFNEAIDVMRQDLAFDKLNRGLRRRISGSKVLEEMTAE